MTDSINTIMERASTALSKMQYLDCQAMCIQAMQLAYQSQDWAIYQRIILPLQEVSRQKRMIALEAVGRLGTGDIHGNLSQLLDEHPSGFIVVTSERSLEEATTLQQMADERQQYFQVLYAIEQDPDWQIQSFTGPSIHCRVKSPPVGQTHRWLISSDNRSGLDQSEAGVSDEVNPPFQPADWFLQASETLGDWALEQIPQATRGLDLLDAIQNCLLACPDHEIIHQRLGQAAAKLLH